MAAAAKTLSIYPYTCASDAALRELVAQHNAGVQDDHVLMAALDAEAGTVDNNYEAQLTATEVSIEHGDDAVEATTAETYEVVGMPEALYRALVLHHNRRVANLVAIVAKLNGDDGITATDYAVTARSISALGEAGASGALHFPGAGAGGSGELLQALITQQAALTQDWHNVAVKLDADGGLADAYEVEITARVFSQV